MTAIYREGEYQIDCSSALWSTNEINSCYHSAGVKATPHSCKTQPKVV